MAINIRLATESDYKAITRVIDDSFTKYINILNQKPSSMVTDYLPLIKNDQMYVLIDTKEIIGTLVLKISNEDMWVSNMAINPNLQKKGLGKKLLKFAEEKAKELRLKTVSLYTSSKIPELYEYYVKQGFKETERKKEDGFDRVYLSKTLIE